MSPLIVKDMVVAAFPAVTGAFADSWRLIRPQPANGFMAALTVPSKGDQAMTPGKVPPYLWWRRNVADRLV